MVQLINTNMKKSKTVIAAIGSIVASIGGMISGDLEMSAAVNIIVTSLLAIFLRHGIKKVEDGQG